jgi:hypothetical protein
VATLEEGRRLLGDALGFFAAAADAPRAAETASALVSVALDQRRFDDALAFARMAVSFANATSDPGRRGSARITLAVTFDVIGRAEDPPHRRRAHCEPNTRDSVAGCGARVCSPGSPGSCACAASAFLAAGSRFVIATTRSVVDDAAAAPAPTLHPGAAGGVAR